MSAPLELSRADARRLAVRAQLLTDDRPDAVLEVVRHLTFVQLDPTRAVAPSADVVLWSRIGAAYDSAELRDLVDRQVLIDHHQLARPAEDLALYRAEMARWPGPEPLRPWQESVRDWVAANDACRLDLLAELRGDGPLPASALTDTCEVPWPSSGWNNDKNLTMMLTHLVERGEVARAGTAGRETLWDLAERVYPDDPVPAPDEARRLRDAKRLRSLGIARPRAPKTPLEPNDVGGAGVPAVVEGVTGGWRVEPSLLDQDFAPRTALLSPLDRLVADRRRLSEVLGYDYLLEMYKPAAQRRWGYWAMPVLHGDRLVGKLDAAADREAGVLRIHALHEDEPFDRATATAVHDEVAALGDWLGLVVERG